MSTSRRWARFLWWFSFGLTGSFVTLVLLTWGTGDLQNVVQHTLAPIRVSLREAGR